MKTKILMITLCFFVGLMGNGLVQAGGNEYGKIKNSAKGIQETQVTMQNAHEIIGMRVVNNQGKELGDVDDVIFSNEGELTYLIVASSGILGGGKELTPIPFHTISSGFHVSKSAVNIPVTQGTFKTAPSFLVHQLDNFQNSKWKEDAHAYFGD